METVGDFTYLGGWLSVGGGREAAVTAKIRRGWVKLSECGELLCCMCFLLKLNVPVYKNYARRTTLLFKDRK